MESPILATEPPPQ